MIHLFSKYSFLICFTLLSLTSLSQNLRELDVRNGFKDFHFGDSKLKWDSVIRKDPEDKIENDYDYIGGCCKTFFLQDLETINLRFDKSNKLCEITLFLDEPLDADQIETLYSFIKDAFGKSTSWDEKPDYSDFKIEWAAAKIILIMYGRYFGKDNRGYDRWSIVIIYALVKDAPFLYKDY